MKKPIFTFKMVVVIVVLGAMHLPIYADTKPAVDRNNSKQTGIELPIQTINIYKPEKFKKFTTIIGQNSALFIPHNDRGNFTDVRLMKAMDVLGLGIIRFPGGTFANFFNWDTMTMDENFINIVKKKNMLNMIKVQTKQKNSKLWETRFDTYIQVTLANAAPL